MKACVGDALWHFVRHQAPSETTLTQLVQKWARGSEVDRVLQVCQLFKTWPEALTALMTALRSQRKQSTRLVKNAQKRKYNRARAMLAQLRKRAAMLAIEDGIP